MPTPTPQPLTGLTPAVLTPFDATGDLNLAAVERQAELLVGDGVRAAFVGGTTGEFSSLSVPEREALTGRWLDVARGSGLRVVVHVGANALPDARHLTAHAAKHGAAAIASVAPSYTKPKTPAALADWCRAVAAAAPDTPFYFYDIPAFTGVAHPMPEFFERFADSVPTLAGVKFSNPDLMAFQRLVHLRGGRFDVVWGFDEYLLAALVLGGRGAVGATYNFAAPLYQKVIDGVRVGDLAAARAAQYRSVEMITLMYRYGFLSACKEVMRARGLDLGPVRLPQTNLTADEAKSFREELSALPNDFG
ncbi:MAG: dihydrodipicolinate synthase family protein [Gemmataceae bacterium]|nr:dihydrodipicolinate synthase family protein [Gemmataceae bacterium]